MPRTFFTQDEYDLLIEFIGWFRENPEQFDYDNNDEIVQSFLIETDSEE